MVKRRRAKASTAGKTKATDKDKAIKSSNSEETSSEKANILGSQEGRVDGSPSATKKPKLDSSQSPSAKKSKRYVPPFTASQRVSNRLRNSGINSEKSEGKSSSQETKVIEGLEGESNDVSKSKQGKGNSQEKSQKETSAMVLESNEEKADEMPSNISVNTKQSDVEMKVENKEEKDSETDTKEDIASENMLETSQKQTGIEIQSVESSTNKPKQENTATPQEIGDQGGQEDFQQVLKLSDLTQQSCDQIETNRRSKEEKRMAKNMIGNKSESLKERMVNKLETSTVIVGQTSDVTRISNIESRISDFDALDLQTLADTCAVVSAVEDVLSVVKEPGKSESSQNKLQNTAERETKGMHRERKDNKNDNNNNPQNLAKEKIPNKNNNVIPEQQQDAIADVIMSSLSKPTTFCEEKTTDNSVNRKIPSSNEIDSKKVQNNFMAILNEPMKKSSLSSQEIIKDKLSEMLSVVTENESNRLPLSQIKSESNTNATTLTENTDKPLDDPVITSVTDTEIMSIESDKCKADGLQESVSNSLVNSDKNSQKATTTETMEVAGNKDLSSQETSERVEDIISKRMDVPMASDKDVHDNDQEVPNKVATSPEQEVPDKMVTSPPSRKEKDSSVILKNNAEAYNHDEVASSMLTSNENSTVISHDESKKVETTEEKVDITTPNNTIDEQSYTEEFKALEELLPRDDMGLFDDVMMSKPKSINVNNELPSGDSTIEFLINELNSLHCMAANYERAVEDMKRQYKSNARF